MPLYLLDTDHISLYQRGHPGVCARYDSLPKDELAASVVSYEEQLRGRLAVLHQANTPESIAAAYLRLGEMQRFFCSLRLVDFDLNAAHVYTTWRRTYRRLDAMDLRIAATALSVNAILVTRNTQDFSAIADLPLENWA
jgi:tRNA(fMet)-specific endonuclease VapC